MYLLKTLYIFHSHTYYMNNNLTIEQREWEIIPCHWGTNSDLGGDSNYLDDNDNDR